MKPDLMALKKKLNELENKITEVKKRMPAHSIKPPIMMELFELEDQKDFVEKQIIQLENRRE